MVLDTKMKQKSKATPWIQFIKPNVYPGQRERSKRLDVIRWITQGAHAYADWVILRDTFRCCVRCGRSDTNLHRDHIIPLVFGGCDCIASIQPLCPECHTWKTTDGGFFDYRGRCMPNWVLAYEERMLERRREVFMGFRE
jgi:5-methylcytosine-specific restriction endonuclease McrA